MHQIPFPYSHDLSQLFNLVEPLVLPHPDIQDIEELTPYAVESRYPGVQDPVNVEDAKAAIQIAENVQKIIVEYLTKKGIIFIDPYFE